MAELFDEVEEEVRREQLKRLWDKYSIVIIALAILIVAGVGAWRGYQYFEGKKAAEASQAFDAAAELSEQNKHAEAEAAFQKLAATAPSGYRVLARLRAAGEVVFRDPKAAAAMYDQIAADKNIPATDQALARLRAGMLLLDTASYDDLRQRLESSTEPTAVYRHSAREVLALSAWRAGKFDEARKWVDMIIADAETPASMRNRVEALQALLPPVAKS